jgi:hypothetical protein
MLAQTAPHIQCHAAIQAVIAATQNINVPELHFIFHPEDTEGTQKISKLTPVRTEYTAIWKRSSRTHKKYSLPISGETYFQSTLNKSSPCPPGFPGS